MTYRVTEALAILTKPYPILGATLTSSAGLLHERQMQNDDNNQVSHFTPEIQFYRLPLVCYDTSDTHNDQY